MRSWRSMLSKDILRVSSAEMFWFFQLIGWRLDVGGLMALEDFTGGFGPWHK